MNRLLSAIARRFPARDSRMPHLARRVSSVERRVSLSVQRSLLLLLFPLLFLSGCLSPRLDPDTLPPGADPIAILGAQYAVSTGADTGYNTVEVFITNRGRHATTFAGGTLDGRELPALNSGALALMAKQFAINLDGASAPSVAMPLPPPDEHVTWWQFYPSAVLPPGGTIICQVNFTGLTSAARALELHDGEGRVLALTVPRFRQPRESITAVTWSLDGKKMYVQYAASGAALESLKVNRQTIKSPVILRAGRPGVPEVAIVDLPAKSPVRRGAPVLIELAFTGGAERRALIRAASGIMLDAPRGWDRDKTLPTATRRTYSLDSDPAITYLPFDVVCGDTHAGRVGAGAPTVANARLAAWRHRPDRLSGVEFCTALYGSVWNIYASIADAVFTKPYQLHWGPDSSRFIESEESIIETAVAAAAPRPAVWVPERFKRERHVEGAELRIMAWTALSLGVKGIRYHYWMNDLGNPFRDCPGLGEAMQAVNADIKRLEPILGPLMPVDVQTDRRQQVRVYTGWSGDAGILLLVRNMRYTTDAKADDDGRSPRFHATSATNITVAIDLPPWLLPRAPGDPLSGETYAYSRTDQRLLIKLPELKETHLIWLANQHWNSS